jgi:hypothetical protein
VPARDAAAALAAKVKRFRFAAKIWKRSHRYIPTSDNNCKFVIDLFDFFEEHMPLSLQEISLPCAARDALALSVNKRADCWGLTSPLGTPRGRCDEYSSKIFAQLRNQGMSIRRGANKRLKVMLTGLITLQQGRRL